MRNFSKKKLMHGFTLIESLVTVAIVAILAAIVLPSYSGMQDELRLRSGTEAIFSDIQYARLFAIKSSSNIYLSFNSSCWGIGNGVATCDCTVSDATQANYCSQKIQKTSDFKGFSLSSSVPSSSIDGTRAIVTNPSVITFTSTGGKVAKVTFNVLGRASICSPSGSAYVSRYKSC